MLYRILRDLGSRDPEKRKAALRMAQNLPWEDLRQFLAFYDKGQREARRKMWVQILCLLLIGGVLLALFQEELFKTHLFFPGLAALVLLPIPIMIVSYRSNGRTVAGLTAVLAGMDDPAFIPIALALLSEPNSDALSCRKPVLQTVDRLLPQLTPAQTQDWTEEERAAFWEGLQPVLPHPLGGRDSLSESPADVSLLILRALGQMGDAREYALVQEVAEIVPITEAHALVRDAAEECLQQMRERSPEVASVAARAAQTPVPKRPAGNRKEVDMSHLLRSRSTQDN